MKKRYLTDPDILSEFQIGYADNSFLAKLPGGREGREIKELLKEIGLLTDKGRLLFSGCLIFPIFDDKDNIVEIYGRRISEKNGSTKLTNRYPNHLYLPGKHRGIFNNKALKASREIILCESVIDSVSLWVNGLKNTTCIWGTGGFNDELLKALKENKIDTVFIAFDNDEAGNNAARKTAGKLAQDNIESLRLELPEKTDVNEYIGKVKNPPENLQFLLSTARGPLLKNYHPKKNPCFLISAK